MVYNIHKIALYRLFICWILLALIIGGINLYLEMKNTDHFFMNLAERDSASFITDSLSRINQEGADVDALRQHANELLKSHYSIVKLYNKDKRKILEERGPEANAVADELKNNSFPFRFAESSDYRKLLINGNVYIQILLPLREKNGTIEGYFAGVYRVDAERVQQITSGVIRALFLVVIVSFITTLVLYPIIIFLHHELLRFASRLLRDNIELMEILGNAIAQRDSDTSLHNYRVIIYAIRLAEAINLESFQILHLITGAFLHDVGKIGISDNILLKPDRLTDPEFTLMRTHVLLGMKIIRKSDMIMEMAGDVVEFHHDKFDGSGYMRGLKGEEIPLNARIFAVVDVFDALTSKRPYKEPYSFDRAMSILHEGSGSHFEPKLVEAFSKIAGEIYAQLRNAPEAEVEHTFKSMASEYFFSSSSLAQFLKNKVDLSGIHYHENE